MKTKIFIFRGSNLFYGICLTMAFLLSLLACAGWPLSGKTTQTETSKPSAESPATAPPSSTPTVSSQPATSDSSPATQVREEKPVVHLVLIYRAYLRAEPSSKGKVITKLKKGEKVVRLGTSDKWVQVELSDKTTGWVRKKQVREEK